MLAVQEYKCLKEVFGILWTVFCLFLMLWRNNVRFSLKMEVFISLRLLLNVSAMSAAFSCCLSLVWCWIAKVIGPGRPYLNFQTASVWNIFSTEQLRSALPRALFGALYYLFLLRFFTASSWFHRHSGNSLDILYNYSVITLSDCNSLMTSHFLMRSKHKLSPLVYTGNNLSVFFHEQPQILWLEGTFSFD